MNTPVKPSPQASTPKPPHASPTPAQEYDRRGVALPLRQRVGGIITPQ